MKLKRIRERNQRILTDLNGFVGGGRVEDKNQHSNNSLQSEKDIFVVIKKRGGWWGGWVGGLKKSYRSSF